MIENPYPLNPLASNWALWSASSLLGCLVDQFPTRSFHHTVLVGLSGVAVTLPVGQTLHHLQISSSVSVFVYGVAIFGKFFFEGRKESKFPLDE